jgi:glutamine cyclotransferase
MNLKSLFTGLIIFSFLSSCGNEYKLSLVSPKKLKANELLTVSVQEKENKPIDSVRFYLNGKRIEKENNSLAEEKLGMHAVSATVFYQGKQKQLTNTIHFFAANAPDIYTYEVVNEFPHDKDAFTQGLEYHNGFLYESTGQNGESSIRKVEIETGKILQKYELDKQFFGEGMTIFDNKIYMLTWQKMMGFVFDLETFEKLSEFPYNQSKEGWGLTHTADKLIKSDGTEKLWFLNPETQKEEHFIEAYTHNRKTDELNELEYINGKIYANKWQKNSILIINHETGAVEGVANLKGLQEKANKKGSDNVLNGIAYDAENDRLFVTGKRWSKLFEIKLKKK